MGQVETTCSANKIQIGRHHCDRRTTVGLKLLSVKTTVGLKLLSYLFVSCSSKRLGLVSGLHNIIMDLTRRAASGSNTSESTPLLIGPPIASTSLSSLDEEDGISISTSQDAPPHSYSSSNPPPRPRRRSSSLRSRSSWPRQPSLPPPVDARPHGGVAISPPT